jgi:hypothetical protein
MKKQKIKIRSKFLAILLMLFSFIVLLVSLFWTLVMLLSIFEYNASSIFFLFFLIVDITMAWVFFIGIRDFKNK